MSFKLQTTLYLSTALCLLSICMCCQALEKLDLQKVYRESQQAAKSLNPKLQAQAMGKGDLSEIGDALNIQGQANHKTTDLGNLPTLGTKAKENDIDNAKCTKASCNVASVMSTKATKQREVKLEEHGFTKNAQQFFKDDKGYIDKSRHNARQFAKNYNAITGSYKDCKQKEQAYSYKENNQCDEYFDVRYDNCPIGQIVEIDPHYTYVCSKKREEKEKRCKEILNLSCAKEEIVKKDPNKMDWSEDLRRIANGMPSSGLLGEYVKIEALAKFLGAKGVCIKNIISHLERFNSYFMFKEEHKDIFTNVVALINPSELGNNKCEIPQEKKCVNWKEEWENKCEYY